jgi:hypothetical protein
MAWLKRKSDPISQRAKELNAEIANLEARIRRLDTQGKPESVPRKPRPGNGASGAPSPAPSAVPSFEPGRHKLLAHPHDSPTTPQHYNEFGVRKYDLVALVERVRGWFRGPAPANEKLVHLLAAGSVQGLRPLRYEKRVARRRFILLVTALLLMLLGIISVFIRNH